MELILITILFIISIWLTFVVVEIHSTQQIDRKWFKAYANERRADQTEQNIKINLILEELNKEYVACDGWEMPAYLQDRPVYTCSGETEPKKNITYGEIFKQLKKDLAKKPTKPKKKKQTISTDELGNAGSWKSNGSSAGSVGIEKPKKKKVAKKK